MKRLCSLLAAVALASGLAYAQDYLPKWQEGYMDIHTIATGRGDATFIIMPDGTTLMIDAGDNGKKKTSSTRMLQREQENGSRST